MVHHYNVIWTYRMWKIVCFSNFSIFFKLLRPLLPCQHLVAFGCTKNCKLVEVSVLYISGKDVCYSLSYPLSCRGWVAISEYIDNAVYCVKQHFIWTAFTCFTVVEIKIDSVALSRSCNTESLRLLTRTCCCFRVHTFVGQLS